MFNKGRGISCMISDFIVTHPDMTTFSLTDDEWLNAIFFAEKEDGIRMIWEYINMMFLSITSEKTLTL